MSPDQLWPLIQVILVDLMLAADNAIVIGLAAASVPAEFAPPCDHAWHRCCCCPADSLCTGDRAVAANCRSGPCRRPACYSGSAGNSGENFETAEITLEEDDGESSVQTKSLRQAVFQIIVADVSMSLDNVLAVAGIARHEPVILVFGLALSVALMAFAATLIARLLERYSWIAYIGLAVILQVALFMIWEGSRELLVLAQA